MAKVGAPIRAQVTTRISGDTNHQQWKRPLLALGIHIAIGAGALLMLFPFLWTLSTSLKLPGSALSWPPQLLPETFHWQNYIEVWSIVPFLTYAQNTVIITLTTVLGSVLGSSIML